ncbi:MAG: hypothetical protein GF401_11990 [Chitinivibrionales bacterium]|nr:hypothetical protein [Chitinivibrionales bacterium]
MGAKNIFSLSASILVFSLISAGFSADENFPEAVDSYFSNLDSYLEKISQSKAMRSRVSTGDNYFLKEAQEHPEIHTFIRTNSKGKIVNEVIEGEVAEKDYRDISNQSWYDETVGDLKPYYGRLKSGNDHYLFWTQPIKLQTRSGGVRSGGAVAVKVDLKDCFDLIARKTDKSFAVRYDNSTIFTHEWDNSGISKTIQPEIQGVPDLSIKYKVGTAQASADEASDKAGATEAKSEKKSPSAKESKDSVSSKAALAEAQGKKEEGGIPGHIIFPAIIAVVAVIFFVIAALIGRHIKQKNQMLLDSIEKDNNPSQPKSPSSPPQTAPRKPPVAPPPPPRPAPQSPPPAASAPKQAPATDDAYDLSELEEFVGPVEQRQTRQAMPAAQRQTPQRPQPQAKSKQKTQPTPNSDNYQQMKKEIYNEAVQYLKSEFEKEYNARLMQKLEESKREIQQVLKKDLHANIQSYNQELGSLVEAMTSIVAESENNLAGRNQQMKQVLEQIKKRMNRGV